MKRRQRNWKRRERFYIMAYTSVKNYITSLNANSEQDEIDIEVAFVASPKTPPSETEVSKMQTFNAEVLRNCIVTNIRMHNQKYGENMKLSTWIKLIKFLDNDFDNGSLTLKTYLQVFLHFPKMSLDEETLKSRGASATMYYEKLLKGFAVGAMEPVSADSMIQEMPAEQVVALKTRILSSSILQAIMLNITLLEDNSKIQSNCNIEYIREAISSAKVYNTISFEPFGSLRGAVLLDGILICKQNVAGSSDTPRFLADLVTLGAHEFSHYVVRLMLNDFNFSSPWKNRLFDEPRFDITHSAPQLLEIGTNTELILFDGIRPDWFASTTEAALFFLEQIDRNNKSLPLISKDKHGDLVLMERSRIPYVIFGIEIRPLGLSSC